MTVMFQFHAYQLISMSSIDDKIVYAFVSLMSNHLNQNLSEFNVKNEKQQIFIPKKIRLHCQPERQFSSAQFMLYSQCRQSTTNQQFHLFTLSLETMDFLVIVCRMDFMQRVRKRNMTPIGKSISLRKFIQGFVFAFDLSKIMV